MSSRALITETENFNFFYGSKKRRRRKWLKFGNNTQYYVKESDVGENVDDQNFLPRLRAPARQWIKLRSD